MTRSLSTIARDINADWRPINYAAYPYYAAMCQLGSIDENYYAESARSIVLYFLSNAKTWRGPVARQIKAELKEMLK